MSVKNLVFIRIDDRLIHGQVMTAWIHQFPECAHIMVVDDQVSKDPFMTKMFQLLLPEGTTIETLSVDDAAPKLKEGLPQQTILLVGDISDIYVTNFNTMMGDPNFTVEELSAIAFGYNRLLEESSNLLLDLKEVTTATGLSMTDKERLDIINRIYGEVLEYKNLTWYYTRKNIGISYLRSKKKGDSRRVLALYGTHEQRYW